MVGYCEQSMYKEFKCIIFIVVVFGGVCIGVFFVVSDFMGVFGFGIGIFFVVM